LGVFGQVAIAHSFDGPGVGGFYTCGFDLLPLTMIFRGNGRVSPVGTGFAWSEAVMPALPGTP
jgi:hypothetical protein